MRPAGATSGPSSDPADAGLAGVDEAGRGPLAGPVVAAAVILDPRRPIAGLADSKRLAAPRRVRLAAVIRERAAAWWVADAAAEEIDRVNVLQATMLAMQRAVAGLAPAPRRVLVDGDRCPSLSCPVQAVVRGDGSVAAIAAASILAKVARDAAMHRWHRRYPQYGFDRHKGYPTAAHLAALEAHGACPIHRRSFAPVRAALDSGGEP